MKNSEYKKLPVKPKSVKQKKNYIKKSQKNKKGIKMRSQKRGNLTKKLI